MMKKISLVLLVVFYLFISNFAENELENCYLIDSAKSESLIETFTSSNDVVLLSPNIKDYYLFYQTNLLNTEVIIDSLITNVYKIEDENYIEITPRLSSNKNILGIFKISDEMLNIMDNNNYSGVVLKVQIQNISNTKTTPFTMGISGKSLPIQGQKEIHFTGKILTSHFLLI